MTTKNNTTNQDSSFKMSINENCNDKGGFCIDDIKDKYPGFRFSSCSSDEIVFTDGTKQIIEVFGRHERTTKNGQHILNQRTIAILQETDSDLYWKLQWLDASRFHGTVAWIQTLFNFFLGVILFIVQLGIATWIFWPLPLGLFVFLTFGTILLSIIEIMGKIYLRKCAQIIYGFFNVLLSIRKNISKDKEKNRAYYKQLFNTLSSANCRDKAWASRIMAKIL